MKRIALLALLSAAPAVAVTPTYTKSLVQWTSLVPLRRITGLVVPQNWQALGPFEELPATEPLPAAFDWKEIVAEPFVVRSQGSCGSCWAWGTTNIVEWALLIRDGKFVDLSEQEILSCSKKGSCGGGYFAHAYQQTVGQSLEEEFPYRALDLKCRSGLSHLYQIKRWGYVGSKRRAPTVDEIKRAILTYGPVAVTVTANTAMKQYRSGIFNGCSTGPTNHIVHLTGWNDREKGPDGREHAIWHLTNSWGENWGENGHMRIKWGCSRVGEIATFIELK